jgi:hypothetical protein
LRLGVICKCLSLPQVHVEFLDGGDKIKVEGPPEEVEKAREQLDAQAKELIGKMSFSELSVDAKYHKHIIGKGGSTGEWHFADILIMYMYFRITMMTTSCASSYPDPPGSGLADVGQLGIGSRFHPSRQRDRDLGAQE